MKKSFIIAASLLLTATVATAQVKFENGTLSALLEKAKTEKKLLFVDCFASWCGPCKYMTNSIFPQKNVGDFMNSNFVNSRFDMEKGDGLTIAKKYNIRSYPTFLFLNQKGEVVARMAGSSSANEFINRVEQALKDDK